MYISGVQMQIVFANSLRYKTLPRLRHDARAAVRIAVIQSEHENTGNLSGSATAISAKAKMTLRILPKQVCCV